MVKLCKKNWTTWNKECETDIRNRRMSLIVNGVECGRIYEKYDRGCEEIKHGCDGYHFLEDWVQCSLYILSTYLCVEAIPRCLSFTGSIKVNFILIIRRIFSCCFALKYCSRSATLITESIGLMGHLNKWKINLLSSSSSHYVSICVMNLWYI